MSKIMDQESNAVDLRDAIIHELGHVFICSHFGIRTKLEIERNTTPGPGRRAWIGHVIYDERKLTRLQRRQIAIAGLIAEQMGDFDHPKECNEAVLVQFMNDYWTEVWHESSIWSKWDWEDATGWTRDDVHFVYETLISEWDELLKLTEFHIKWTTDQTIIGREEASRQPNGFSGPTGCVNRTSGLGFPYFSPWSLS